MKLASSSFIDGQDFSAKQESAARKNIKKAQEKWQSMSKRQRTLAQPQGRGRAKPGSTGKGEYYRIEVRPKENFTTFRNQDIGDPGHIQRLAGRRSSGSWATHAWLVSKEDAHISGEKLIPDSKDAKELLEMLESEPQHIKGDIFKAKDRRNVPEAEKPTKAQRSAQQRNIKKAQAARAKK